MDYIQLNLPRTNILPGQDPYPERDTHDIVKAIYHDEFPEKDNPDISALPPRISDIKLCEKCVSGYPGYNRESVNKMKLSERLIALDSLKDYVRVYLPFYLDFSRRLLACLLSAYRGRSFAIGKEHFRAKKVEEVDSYTLNEIGEDQVLSVSPIISSSVQCLALVGVAGSGKSTCLEFNLSLFPHGIRHDLPGGYKYVEIPFLQLSAVDINDTKALFIKLAAQIDQYIGHGNIYKGLMIKKQNISKMLDYFDELSSQFHVGMVIVDEVQLIKDKNVFHHLLSLSNSSHVSICLVGTESAMTFLHKDSWAMRRFGELGFVKADFGNQKKQVMESTLRQLWKYQFTYKFTDTDIPDDESEKLLVEASMGNIDLLTTLFIKAQRIALKNKNTCLTTEIIGQAVKSIEEAKELLESEQKVIEKYVSVEKENLKKQIQKDISVEKEREAKARQEAAEKAFCSRTDALEDLTYRIGNVSDFSYKKIEAAYDRIVASGKDLVSLDPKQRAKLVLSELTEEELAKKHKKSKNEKTVEKKEVMVTKKKRKPSVNLEAGLEEVLLGGINDFANISTDAS